MPSQRSHSYTGIGKSKGLQYTPSTADSSQETMEGFIRRVRPEVSVSELELVLSVMSKAFCYFPERRISAEELLLDPSFQALMKLYIS
jgi:hypothetical protein